MRESIGGGWLFGIVIVFIFMFSGFLAYSVSYTKAFNVKNEIINYIEQGQGYTGHDQDVEKMDPNDLPNTVKAKAYNLINKSGYDWETNVLSSCPSGKKLNEYGVCIEKFCPKANTTKNKNIHNISDVHYKVTTFITFQIPFFGIKFTIPLTGETSTIKSDYSTYKCVDEITS